MKLWTIKNNFEFDEETGECLFWNNDWGWGSHDEATGFTLEEKENTHHLPMCGEWVAPSEEEVEV